MSTQLNPILRHGIRNAGRADHPLPGLGVASGDPAGRRFALALKALPLLLPLPGAQGQSLYPAVGRMLILLYFMEGWCGRGLIRRRYRWPWPWLKQGWRWCSIVAPSFTEARETGGEAGGQKR